MLRLLGLPCVNTGTWQPVPLNTPTSLLLYLAAAADWVSRRELAYLYKPDSSEAEALSYLRLQLHRATQYPWATGVEVGKQQVRWLVPTDVQAIRAHHTNEEWAEAVALYSGPFLAGLEDSGWPTFDSWLELERESHRLLYQEALRAHALSLRKAGNTSAALEAYRKLLAEDELDEPTLRQIMRTLAEEGRNAEAIRQYERFSDLLSTELGVMPDARTAALAVAISSAAADVEHPAGDAAPDPTVSVVADDIVAAHDSVAAQTLPKATTKFIGRESELGQLMQMVTADDVRLVTLVGIGGTGKTRLAIELARRSQRLFRGGARFVSLVETSLAAQALERIATALELDVATDADLEGAVGEHVTQPTLLVLDNCEQVDGLAQLVARLLAGNAHIKVLCTSRKTLDLVLEHIFDVRGLTLPQAESGHDLADSESLFVVAARRVLPRFELTEEDKPHVHRICRYVDGLPLALELASAWVRAMPVQRIADELQRGFDLLTSDQADLAQRHRSVESVLVRTWDSLTDRKAHTLAAMSIFQDGCTLEAAESVSQGELPILLSLVNQSLLHRTADGRFGCHPLVAQFSAKALAQNQELQAAASQAHADFYGELLLRFAPDRQGKDAPSMRVLEPDIGNVEKAWLYLLTSGQVERLAALVDSLVNYYTVIGQYRRGMDFGALTLGLLTEQSPIAAQVRCSLRLAHCNMAKERGLLPDALSYANAVTEEAEQQGLAEMRAKGRRFSGDVLQMMGRFDEAAEAYEEAVAQFTRLGEKSELANTLNSLASMDAVRERHEEATTRFKECVVLFEQVGDVLAKAIALNNLGYLADANGQTEAAASYYEASLVDFERIQYTRGIAAVKNNLVVLYGSLGRMDEAEAAGKESLALKADMEDRLGIIISLKNLGDLLVNRGEPQGAMTYYLPAIKLALEVQAVPRLLQVLPGYANALAGLGRAMDAHRVRTALALHPLTPPSSKQRVVALLSETPVGEHEQVFDELVTYLQVETVNAPSAHAVARAVALA